MHQRRHCLVNTYSSRAVALKYSALQHDTGSSAMPRNARAFLHLDTLFSPLSCVYPPNNTFSGLFGGLRSISRGIGRDRAGHRTVGFPVRSPGSQGDCDGGIACTRAWATGAKRNFDEMLSVWHDTKCNFLRTSLT